LRTPAKLATKPNQPINWTGITRVLKGGQLSRQPRYPHVRIFVQPTLFIKILDRPDIILLAIFFLIAESWLLAPVAAGVPDYESLDVIYGILVEKDKCTGGRRNLSYLPVVIETSNGKRNLKIDCTSQVATLNIGEELVVRTRNYFPFIFIEGRPDVWSVSTKNGEIYRYIDRVKIEKEIICVFFFLSIFVSLTGFIGIKRMLEKRGQYM